VIDRRLVPAHATGFSRQAAGRSVSLLCCVDAFEYSADISIYEFEFWFSDTSFGEKTDSDGMAQLFPVEPNGFSEQPLEPISPDGHTGPAGDKHAILESVASLPDTNGIIPGLASAVFQ